MKTKKGTTEVSWAKELGIDLQELREESFDHPRQFRKHMKHRKNANAYWEWKEGVSNAKSTK